MQALLHKTVHLNPWEILELRPCHIYTREMHRRGGDNFFLEIAAFHNDYHAENYFISHAYTRYMTGKKVTFSGTGDHSPIYSAYAAARSQRRHKNLVKLQIPGSRLYVMWEIRIVDIKNPAAHNSHFRQVIELLMRLTYHFSSHKIFILSSHIKSQECCCCDSL